MPELETAGGEDAHHIAEYGERGKCDQRGKRGGVAKLRGYLLLGIAVGKLEGKMLLIFRCRVCPKFCVNTAKQCKIEPKYFKAGAASAVAALSTK